jgi:hypothetical protein
LNYPRLLLATVAAAVVDFAYGSLVYGTLLESEISVYGGIFRSVSAVNALLPVVVVVLVGGGLGASILFAKGFATGRPLASGVAFGTTMALFSVCYVTLGNYVVLEMPRRLTLELCAAQAVEWLIVGVTIAAVYRPPAR